MRILLVNRYYNDKRTPTARMLHDVVSELEKLNCEVEVLTSKNIYIDKNNSYEQKSFEKIKYIRVGSGKNKALSWVLFWLQVCILLPVKKWDKSVILTDPPFMVFAAFITKLFRSSSRKIYWWTMDLYPESIVAHGIIKKNGYIHRTLLFLNGLGLKKIDGVICLGHRQLNLLKKHRHWKDDASFNIIIPPWDYRDFKNISRTKNDFLINNNWQDKTIILYAGNLGNAHSYKKICKVARQLHGINNNWLFLFVCRGTLKNKLKAESKDLSNIIVLDYLPVDKTSELLSSADIHLITMKDGWQGISVPSKLYGVMQTKSPVLFLGPDDSDTADEIIKYKAGEIISKNLENEAIIDIIQNLLNNKDRKDIVDLDFSGAAKIAKFVVLGSKSI